MQEFCLASPDPITQCEQGGEQMHTQPMTQEQLLRHLMKLADIHSIQPKVKATKDQDYTLCFVCVAEKRLELAVSHSHNFQTRHKDRHHRKILPDVRKRAYELNKRGHLSEEICKIKPHETFSGLSTELVDQIFEETDNPRAKALLKRVQQHLKGEEDLPDMYKFQSEDLKLEEDLQCENQKQQQQPKSETDPFCQPFVKWTTRGPKGEKLYPKGQPHPLNFALQKKLPIVGDLRDPEIWEKLVSVMKELNQETYHCVVMDYPWKYKCSHPSIDLAYPTMVDKDLEDFPIELVQSRGYIYKWVVFEKFLEGWQWLEKKGYRVVEVISWVKRDFNGKATGVPCYHGRRIQEICLLGVKGSVDWDFHHTSGTDSFDAKRENPQSRKPKNIYEMAEKKKGDGLFLDLFGRVHNQRYGWVTCGLEAQQLYEQDTEKKKMRREKRAQAKKNQQVGSVTTKRSRH